MQTRTYKSDVFLELSEGEATGVAHVIETEYREGLTFCCFVMEATTDSHPVLDKSLNKNPVSLLHFPDDRQVTVLVSEFRLVEDECVEIVGTGVF